MGVLPSSLVAGQFTFKGFVVLMSGKTVFLSVGGEGLEHGMFQARCNT